MSDVSEAGKVTVGMAGNGGSLLAPGFMAVARQDVTLLARRRVLLPGELRCVIVECYKRRQTPTSKTILACSH